MSLGGGPIATILALLVFAVCTLYVNSIFDIKDYKLRLAESEKDCKAKLERAEGRYREDLERLGREHREAVADKDAALAELNNLRTQEQHRHAERMQKLADERAAELKRIYELSEKRHAELRHDYKSLAAESQSVGLEVLATFSDLGIFRGRIDANRDIEGRVGPQAQRSSRHPSASGRLSENGETIDPGRTRVSSDDEDEH